MAELELITIENGMASGGDAIGKNFDAVKGAIDDVGSKVKDTGWVSLTLTASAATGALFIRRVGSDVYLAGQVTPVKTAGLSTQYVFATIPQGFRPDQTGERYRFKTTFSPSSSASDELRLQLSASNGALSIIYAATNALKLNYPSDWHWTTNDDFPS